MFGPGCAEANTLIVRYNLAISKVDAVSEKLEEIYTLDLKDQPETVWEYIVNTKEDFELIK